jgi:hypothetical protein
MELTRRGVIRLAGAAGLAAATGAVLAAAPASPALADQNGWRWCQLCQGLWFAGNPTLGVCPARGTAGHSFTGSGNYTLTRYSDAFPGGQDGWFWCSRCAGLWYVFNNTRGVCPAGSGGHSYNGSDDYAIDLSNDGGQGNWRWCFECQGLWFAGNRTRGVCPVLGTGGHGMAGSGIYYLNVN